MELMAIRKSELYGSILECWDLLRGKEGNQPIYKDKSLKKIILQEITKICLMK